MASNLSEGSLNPILGGMNFNLFYYNIQSHSKQHTGNYYTMKCVHVAAAALEASAIRQSAPLCGQTGR